MLKRKFKIKMQHFKLRLKKKTRESIKGKTIQLEHHKRQVEVE